MAELRTMLRLYRLYLGMDLLYLARPRVALPYMLSDMVLGVATLTATFLLAERFGGLGPWSSGQVLFLLGYALIVRGLTECLFNYNVEAISRRIGRGQLDHVLVQPNPLWMILLTEGFAPISGCSNLLIGVGLMAWSVAHIGTLVSAGWLALLLLNVLASLLVVMAFNYLWGTLAFWAPRATEEINSSTVALLQQLGPLPLDGLSSPALVGLLSLVPVGLVAWLPSRALLGLDVPPLMVLATPLLALALAVAAMVAFRAGLRHYARTGSSRYLAHGHRR